MQNHPPIPISKVSLYIKLTKNHKDRFQYHRSLQNVYWINKYWLNRENPDNYYYNNRFFKRMLNNYKSLNIIYVISINCKFSFKLFKWFSYCHHCQFELESDLYLHRLIEIFLFQTKLNFPDVEFSYCRGGIIRVTNLLKFCTSTWHNHSQCLTLNNISKSSHQFKRHSPLCYSLVLIFKFWELIENSEIITCKYIMIYINKYKGINMSGGGRDS